MQCQQIYCFSRNLASLQSCFSVTVLLAVSTKAVSRGGMQSPTPVWKDEITLLKPYTFQQSYPSWLTLSITAFSSFSIVTPSWKSKLTTPFTLGCDPRSEQCLLLYQSNASDSTHWLVLVEIRYPPLPDKYIEAYFVLAMRFYAFRNGFHEPSM